ncbi:hypothetical protein [Vibrio scophthalmi]|uniref:Secreted protein n=1 Tax=Vibrio scophthalmi LMG 19158 TaxID=870967 RepID=F9RIZ1_9VIBR|nr:hypothetical protein [Vibrio scophthalmi]EGU41576.1 hypothetical protein VIS19158_07410 [Vibrio scophthalmi LMG 19158]
MKEILIALGITLSISSFSASAAFGINSIDQAKVCQFANGDEAQDRCKDGDVAMWTPQTFGNEQTPLYYVSLFCDFDAPIIHNIGGVSCIFTTKRKAQWVDYGVQKK